MAKKLVLGKGIASLIQSTPNEVITEALKNEFVEMEKEKETPRSENGILLVDIGQIAANKNQPRKIFKEKELLELADSIKENGILQPLIVTKAEIGFELIAGERRLRASKMAGLEKVPVIVKRVTDRDKMIMSILENVQRADLNCVEEALAYYQLMDDFNLTQEEVAKKLGKERSSVANFLRVLKLPREVVDLLQKEKLSFGHAKILASEKERDRTIFLANEVVVKNLSVRELEELMLMPAELPQKPKNEGAGRNEAMESLRFQLEKQTGFHFQISQKKNKSGKFVIKFSDLDEFNKIFEYFVTK